MKSLLFSVFLAFPLLIAGESCQNAKASHSVYTTTEASASTQTVFVIDFDLQCSNNPKDLNIYAEMGGRTVLASKNEKGKYQVSFSDEHKKLAAGHYTMRVFDDEGFTELRKAQRNNEDTSSVKSLFKVEINHPGASKGPWLQSEFVASVSAFLVVYLAHSARSKLQPN